MAFPSGAPSRLQSFCFVCYSSLALEKATAFHSSTLAWKIPWTEEPGGLQSLGSLRVGHDWVTSLSLFTFLHWRRKWQPTPVFLPGESQGRRSLVGCRLWGRTESDTTEATAAAAAAAAAASLALSFSTYWILSLHCSTRVSCPRAICILWHTLDTTLPVSLWEDLRLAPRLSLAEKLDFSPLLSWRVLPLPACLSKSCYKSVAISSCGQHKL